MECGSDVKCLQLMRFEGKNAAQQVSLSRHPFNEVNDDDDDDDDEEEEEEEEEDEEDGKRKNRGRMRAVEGVKTDEGSDCRTE